MANECVTIEKNLGVTKCTKLPGLIRLMIETPDNFSLMESDVATPQSLLTALNTSALLAQGLRTYVWPDLIEFTDKSEAQVYEQNALATLAVRDGRYQFLFGVHKDLCTHVAMFTHRKTGSGRVFFVDSDNNMFGTQGADGLIRGFSLQLLHTEKFTFNDGSKTTKSPVYVVLEDSHELDQDGVIFDGSAVDLAYKLTDLIITVNSASSTVWDVTVLTLCDGTPILGLLTADFIAKKADGTNEPAIVAAAVAGQPGTYTLTGVALTDGTLSLRTPDLLTVKAYELEAPVAVVVT